MGFAVAGFIAIVALGLAYLSFKTWRVVQVLMVVLICFAAATNFYLAARTLKTLDVWRTLAQQRQVALDALEKDYAGMLNGEEEQGKQIKQGIRQVKLGLYKLAMDRGAVYYDVQLKTKVNDQTGAVTVTIEAPDPHGLVPKVVVFAFDQAAPEDGGRYLGEFKVTAAPDMSKEVELAPNLPLPTEELQRLANNNGPWILYLLTPLDKRELFAELDHAAKMDLLNKLSQQEPAPPYIDPNRPLRGYEFAYHEFQVQSRLLREENRRLQVDIDKTLTAQKKAQEEVDYRDKEKKELEDDRAVFKTERDAVTAHEKTLEDAKAVVRGTRAAPGEIYRVYFANKQLMEELLALQLKAAEAINRQTGLAGAGGVGNLPSPFSAVRP